MRGAAVLAVIAASAATPEELDASRAFTNVYDTHRWGRAGRGSGTGSGIPFTEELRKTLTKFCLEHNITSMADTPSGAMLWTDVWLKSMPSSFRYFGGDVVKSVVEANDARWAHDPQKSFGVVDISKTPPPKGYDVILCRDALQHLPYRMVFDAFDLFSRSDAKYLLVGSYRSGTPNFDVKVPGHRAFNPDFSKTPFELEPEAILVDAPLSKSCPQCSGDDPSLKVHQQPKYLYVYPIAYLRTFDFKAMKAKALGRPDRRSLLRKPERQDFSRRPRVP